MDAPHCTVVFHRIPAGSFRSKATVTYFSHFNTIEILSEHGDLSADTIANDVESVVEGFIELLQDVYTRDNPRCEWVQA